MRAEAQAHIDQINQSLDLVRRFLDWDRALRRLDELNARVEDPKLWDDAKAAQENELRDKVKSDPELARLVGDAFDAIAAAEARALPRRHEFRYVGFGGSRLLGMAVTKLGFSARAHDRLLRVARTIADLAGADTISAEHVSEAIQYRTLDRAR